MNAIELFAGAGLMGLGLRDAGFEVVDAVEIDDRAAEAHRRNVGSCKTMDARAYHPPGRVDLVAGGAPCPTFSYAGNRDGTTAERGQLYLELLRVSLEAGARAVWMENVPGLMTANDGRDLKQILAAFRDAGFYPRHAVLDAADYGAAQRRRRFLLVAFRDRDVAREFVRPTATHGPGLLPHVSLRVALGLRGQYAVGGGQRLDHATSSAKGKERGWWQGGRMLDVERPGYTVGTRDNADLLVPSDDVAVAEVEAMRARSGRRPNPRGYRLNVPELAALQGFPLGYEFVGTQSEQHAQVGNALPRPLGAAVARAIATALVEASVKIRTA